MSIFSTCTLLGTVSRLILHDRFQIDLLPKNACLHRDIGHSALGKRVPSTGIPVRLLTPVGSLRSTSLTRDRICCHRFIEGKSGFTNLVSAPAELFASMTSLTFVQLGVHTQLTSLPSFQGLENLKALTLAVLVKLVEMPSLAPLERLERLTIVALPSVAALPDMAPISKNLNQLEVGSLNTVCCNGFLRGDCNLTHPFCVANADFNLPAAQCVAPSETHATASTLRLFDRFASSVCQTDGPNVEPVLQINVDACNGVRWSQCVPFGSASGTQGICANLRMQVLFCSADQSVIKLRRQQIRLGIGEACNSSVEAWLGCAAT